MTFNMSFLPCTTVELFDLIDFISANGEKVDHTMPDIILVQAFFSNSTKFSHFMSLDRLLFELSCRDSKTHGYIHGF